MGLALSVRLGGVQVAGIAWLAEILLEALGAWFFWSRGVLVLRCWLQFRLFADLFCFVLLRVAGYQAYSWADYVQRTIQYALFAAVCVYAAGQILREDAKTRRFYLVGICIAVGLAIARVHSVWPMSMATFYGLEIWVEMILAALVAYALGIAKGKAPHPWGTIGAALVVMGGSDGGITLLRQQAMLQNGLFASVLYGRHFEAWYPVGAIAGLAMLAWAGWRDWRLEGVIRELPLNIDPEIFESLKNYERAAQLLTGAPPVIPNQTAGIRSAAAVEMMYQQSRWKGF